MPAVFRPQSHLPLTPPEFFPAYAGCGGVQLNAMQFAVGHQGMGHEKSFKAGFGNHENTYGAFQYQSQDQYASNMNRMFPAGAPPPAAMSSELPGLVEDAPRHQRQEAAEERPVGGVSAHLDYEMEDMAEFVATIAQNIVQPNMSMPAPFRKFVSQILSSTRLPSSTILLGLEYLSKRMKGLANTHRSSGHVYRMLTIALLLASKFLDDNTFQNKSWAEVTGLPVAELNTLELEWLGEIDWNLHVDPTGKKGFEIWRQTWEKWRDAGAAATKVTNDRVLAPINTQIASHHRNSIHGTFSPPPTAYPGSIGDRVVQLPPPQALQQSHHENNSSYWWPASADRSPPFGTETGPATPDYGFNNWGMPFSALSLTPTHHSMRVSSATLPPLALYGHHQNVWPGAPCGCNQCGRGSDYFMNANYSQAVVG
ncbi:hypothetical protein DFH27DRAFT_484386 [Peziza echinospora]|nr:hypothetical protein DFH27DRAFT_484386 [Peziza echinospora]